MAKISQSSTLIAIAYVFGLTSIAFGLNAIFNPVFALTFFEAEYPTTALPSTKRIIDTLMLVYGVRDIFMGFATLVAAYYKVPKVLGPLIIATAGIAVADGAICYYVNGSGQWNHWPLAPMVFGVGGVFLGWFDRA